MSKLEGKKCVVIGGCGFLGHHLVESLLDRKAQVTVVDIRKNYSNDKVEFVIGDLNTPATLKTALKDAYVVFHVASPPPELDDRTLFFNVNVKGTKAIIQACKEMGVKRLVLTSSCSVIYEGKDLENADEKTPYAANPIDVYVETKILQEQEVLKANDGKNFLTVAIRPHGIYGPKDVVCSQMLLQARKGLKFMIGNGKNLVDFTHVKNVALGHILAAERLEPESPLCGQAYNITNDSPIPFWGFFGKLATGMGYAAPTIPIPYQLALVLSMILNFFLVLLRPIVHIQTTFIPSRICLAGTHHYYNCEKAKRELGYKPIYNMEEGIKHALASYSELRNGKKKAN